MLLFVLLKLLLLNQSLVKLEGWEKIVTIVSSDMRCWEAPEKADILVRTKPILIINLQVTFYYVISC